ncbi:MAG: DUF72 domain-containing protein [Planctomycetota bacterium]|jgi:uncharacterized protein YecE (DUF72 family)
MAKTKCDIRVSTSGWHYNHWIERFYPDDLPKSKWLQYYARQFDTVEINNTFYQLPKEISVRRWRELAPEGFLYTVKANRYITHIKRLKDTSQELKRFFERTNLLKEKLGPILYQLPPSMHKDLDLLEAFTKLLPKKRPAGRRAGALSPRAVFEFRHESWYVEDTYTLLNQYNVAFCTHDLPGKESPRVITGDIIYVRFHGTTGRYSGNYSTSALQEWAGWIKDNLKGIRAVYAYFNNDYNAYAINNARTLREVLSE